MTIATFNMNLFKNPFGKKSDFDIKFDKTENQYQVYREKQLLYVGTKELCQRFIKNSPVY